MANLKPHRGIGFKHFRQENGIKSDFIYFHSYAYKRIYSRCTVFSSASFHKVILILLQYSPLCKTDSKNLVILTQRSKLNEFVLLCKGKKHLSLKVRRSFIFFITCGCSFLLQDNFPHRPFQIHFTYHLPHFITSEYVPLFCLGKYSEKVIAKIFGLGS